MLAWPPGSHRYLHHKGDAAAHRRREDFLFSLGFSDFRVRMTPEGGAKLQLPASQLSKLLQERQKVLCKLKEYYPSVVLDLEVRHE